MSEHTRISDLLPEYVSGALEPEGRQAVEKHLAECSECRADLALWGYAAGVVQESSQAVSAPRRLADQALARTRAGGMTAGRKPANSLRRGAPILRRGALKLQHGGQILRAQIPLVQREIWPASAAVMALGYIAALIAEHSGFVYALAPLIAAACVSLIYGPENDPAFELALSTPTSPRQILLARLALVFGYNLGLVLVATLGLLPVLPMPVLGELALAWLAPMTFLSAAALLLSLWIGAPNAISVTYVAWLVQLLSGPLRSPQMGVRLSPAVTEILSAYQGLWQSPPALLALSALLFAAAIWLAGRSESGRLAA